MGDYFINHPSKPQLELSVVEAYSKQINKILLYDLLDSVNQKTRDWDKKKGSSSLEVKNCKKVMIKDGKHGRGVILKAQKSAHTALTGKNPESSRGHTMFLLKVIPKSTANSSEMMPPSTFVFADLAGSEGETALKGGKLSKAEMNLRRMEGGVINSGLSALQSIFRELKKSGKVAKVGR